MCDPSPRAIGGCRAHSRWSREAQALLWRALCPVMTISPSAAIAKSPLRNSYGIKKVTYIVQHKQNFRLDVRDCQ